MIKPITTEKAVKLIETENTLLFEVDKRNSKEKIKKEIEKTFNVKIEKVRTHTQKNIKRAYVKLDKSNLAIDVATKLGLI